MSSPQMTACCFFPPHLSLSTSGGFSSPPPFALCPPPPHHHLFSKLFIFSPPTSSSSVSSSTVMAGEWHFGEPSQVRGGDGGAGGVLDALYPPTPNPPPNPSTLLACARSIAIICLLVHAERRDVKVAANFPRRCTATKRSRGREMKDRSSLKFRGTRNDLGQAVFPACLQSCAGFIFHHN